MLTVQSIKQSLHDDFPLEDDKFLRLLQQADDRLLELGRWEWTRQRINLTVTLDSVTQQNVVTLAPEYTAIIGIQLDESGGDIRAEEFEFAVGGVGNVQSADGNIELIDQGFQDVTDGNTTERRRVYKATGGVEVGTVIVALVHYAPALLYDPDMIDETDTGTDNDTPADATDITRCQSLAALKLCMFGIIFENQGDNGRARAFMADSHHVLDNKQHTHQGGARQIPNLRANGPHISRVRSFR